MRPHGVEVFVTSDVETGVEETVVVTATAGVGEEIAVAVGGTPTSPSDVPCSVARALSGESGAGWDPYEVWLRRIDQPRRRRTDVVPSRD